MGTAEQDIPTGLHLCFACGPALLRPGTSHACTGTYLTGPLFDRRPVRCPCICTEAER